MKVIIAGPRTLYVKNRTIYKAIEASGFDVTEIISGGASGIDSCAIEYARDFRIPLSVYYADWSELGKAAGPARNKQMAGQADALIIIKEGEHWTRGTKSMFKAAQDEHLKVYVSEINNPTRRTLENTLEGMEIAFRQAEDEQDTLKRWKDARGTRTTN